MGKKKSGKSKVVAISFILAVLTIMIAAGYIGVKQWWAQNQPRRALTAIKTNADVLGWSYRHIPELYFQIVALDDVISLLETELNRLKELGKKYPDQKAIIAVESTQLKKKQDELTDILTKAGKAIEAIYVTYKIDPRKGQQKIGSKETYDLGKHLKSTLKTHSRLAYRINSQKKAETWTDKIKKMI